MKINKIRYISKILLWNIIIFLSLSKKRKNKIQGFGKYKF